ncbi:MAG: DinB family protein [Bacteroidota bacterium]
MKLTEVAAALLKDAQLYLNTISVAAYQKPVELLSQSSIGQHSRHFIEFYQCLHDHIQRPEVVVNYDQRQRNKQIERNPAYASAVIDQIIKQLEAEPVCERLKLVAEYTGDMAVAIDSSYDRELMYNIEHTIHHMAIIKIGLKLVAPQLALPADFGVAPSTVKYRTTCAQ